MHVLVKGAGVAGLAVAHELWQHGVSVEVSDIAARPGAGASWFAAGMLAPWCECESAPEAVLRLGERAAAWWEAALPGYVAHNGTLVVAPARDMAELGRFASRTQGHELLDETGIAELEPALVGRFRKGLFFRGEAHLDSRTVLNALFRKLVAAGVKFRFGQPVDAPELGYDHVVDCAGAWRIGSVPGLRGVRGEMLMLETAEVTLARPVRLLHPRIPLYIVPRRNSRFMVGATMIESDDDGPVSARSVMELLNATYTLHPAFGEARLVETGVGVRPAYPDNLPTVVGDDHGGLFINGCYRHGFLLAPALAQQAAARLGVISPGARHGTPYHRTGAN